MTDASTDRKTGERIAEILASLPPKSSRSRLEPYRGLIREMRRRGRTYREIAEVLGDRCGVRVTASSVHEFVRRRSRPKPPVAMDAASQPAGPAIPAEAPDPAPTPALAPGPTITDMRQRIEAIKQRPAPAPVGQTKPVFTYNENEPLRVRKASEG